MPDGRHTSYMSHYLDKVDGEEDRLLPHTDVVGDDVTHKGVLGHSWAGLFLEKITSMN